MLGAFGMRGRRVTAAELEWLLYRSVALCMAPPTHAVPGRRTASGSAATCSPSPSRSSATAPRTARTVKLVNRMTGEERHVAVLTVGRMEPLEIPERHEPWLHFHERLPWPMELSSRVDILGPGDSFRNLEHRLRMIRSQQLDYAEHGMDAPPELERLAKRALVIGDEMTTGLPVDSARAHGWHRIAVGGAHPRGVPGAGPPAHPALLAASCASRCSTRRTRTGWPASSSPASRSPTPATCAGCRSSCSPPRCPRPRPPSATGAAT